MALRITLFNRPNIAPLHLNTPSQSHQQSQQSQQSGREEQGQGQGQGQGRAVSSGSGSGSGSTLTLTWEGIGELSGDNPIAIAALLKDIDRSPTVTTSHFIYKLLSIYLPYC